MIANDRNASWTTADDGTHSAPIESARMSVRQDLEKLRPGDFESLFAMP